MEALDYAMGAVLLQKSSQDHSIVYASRILNKAEQKYNTIKKELLTIVWL